MSDPRLSVQELDIHTWYTYVKSARYTEGGIWVPQATIQGQQRSSTNSLHFIARQIAYRSISTQDRHWRRNMDPLWQPEVFQTVAIFTPDAKTNLISIERFYRVFGGIVIGTVYFELLKSGETDLYCQQLQRLHSKLFEKIGSLVITWYYS